MKIVWCPKCKIKDIWNEMERGCIGDEYDYKCDICQSEYSIKEIKHEKEK